MKVLSEEEFAERLNKLCCWKNRYTHDDLLEILIFGNEAEKEKIVSFKKECDVMYEGTMENYRKASDEEKKRIIGSIKKMV